MQTSKQKGFNLLELMITLAIIGILNTLLIPSISSSLSKLNAQAEIYQLLSFIGSARKYALIHKNNVHICSLDIDNKNCLKQWNSQLISFIDTNKNKRFDSLIDKQLNSIRMDSKYSSLTSKSLNYINFNKLGMNNKIGSIFFCYKNNQSVILKKISASMQGRFKVYEDDASKCSN